MEQSEKIIPLKGADRVRKRPAVIFGSADAEGRLGAIGEIIENSIKEALLGNGNQINITRYEDGSYTVEDFGRGIPVEYSEKEQAYLWQKNFCEIYAAPLYSEIGNEFAFSIGTQGIGLCCTQYVCQYMYAAITRDGFRYLLHFEKGNNIGGLKKEKAPNGKTGTVLKFRLDNEVFGDDVTFDMMNGSIQKYAVTNCGISFSLEWHEGGCCRRLDYCYQSLSHRMKEMCGRQDAPLFEKQISAQNGNTVAICICLCGQAGIKESYCNRRRLRDGGVVVWQTEKLIAQKLREMFPLHHIERQSMERRIDEVIKRVGIIAVAKIAYERHIRWTNGARTAISNPEFAEAVQLYFESSVTDMINANHSEIEQIMNRPV